MTKIVYLFDPLCGWCYGAGPTVRRLRDIAGLTVTAMPTGLFAGEGARPMDEGFAAYAWANDQRIAQLTGQRFTQAYRSNVLHAAGGSLDSGPATLALMAVSLDDPARELDALAAIQNARYVDGRDITSPSVLAGILRDAGFDRTAARLAAADDDLVAANSSRIADARALLAALGARGVPALVAGDGSTSRLVPASALFGNFDSLAADLQAR